MQCHFIHVNQEYKQTNTATTPSIKSTEASQTKTQCCTLSLVPLLEKTVFSSIEFNFIVSLS